MPHSCLNHNETTLFESVTALVLGEKRLEINAHEEDEQSGKESPKNEAHEADLHKLDEWAEESSDFKREEEPEKLKNYDHSTSIGLSYMELSIKI